MRPRLARRGEPPWSRTSLSNSKPLQCGPGSLAGENHRDGNKNRLLPYSFNAAPARSPGRTKARRLLPLPPKCFNAAPARSPGRTQTARLLPARRLQASMRPRLARRGELHHLIPQEDIFCGGFKLQCGPGSLAGENRFVQKRTSRNQYASMRPRLARRGELRSPLELPAIDAALQCGPGSLAEENLRLCKLLTVFTQASMRPRLARRGEPRWQVGHPRRQDALQCGPGSLAGEN